LPGSYFKLKKTNPSQDNSCVQASTTTRAAGGLDFTAKGSERQFGKPNQSILSIQAFKEAVIANSLS
jgi:hypothetical protein